MGIEERVRLLRRSQRNGATPIKVNTYLRNLNQTYGSLAIDAELRKQNDEEKDNDD